MELEGDFNLETKKVVFKQKNVSLNISRLCGWSFQIFDKWELVDWKIEILPLFIKEKGETVLKPTKMFQQILDVGIPISKLPLAYHFSGKKCITEEPYKTVAAKLLNIPSSSSFLLIDEKDILPYKRIIEVSSEKDLKIDIQADNISDKIITFKLTLEEEI